MKTEITIPIEQVPDLKALMSKTSLSREKILQAGLQSLIESKDDPSVIEALRGAVSS